MVGPSRRLHARIKPEARRTIDIVGGIGLLVVFILFLRAQEYDLFLYRGGFLLLSVATAMAVAALAHPASRLGPIVGCRPMLWVGQRSYGIYLWHFPIIVLTTPDGAQGVDLPRAFLQVAATFIVAALSWKYVEDPIRHGALRRIWADFKGGRYRRENITRGGWAAIGGCAVVLMAAFAGLAGAGTGPDRSEEPGNISVAQTVTGKETDAAESNRTICKSVVHGDSTSEGLVSDAVPDLPKQIAAQYDSVERRSLTSRSGRLLDLRALRGEERAEVAQAWRDRFDGRCSRWGPTRWPTSMGRSRRLRRADRFDDEARGRQGPVLWVNVKSISVPGGPTRPRTWGEPGTRRC